ncbi:MAG: hypothetical protein ACXW3Y_14310, partial [Rhodoplanes sp.]
AHEELCRHISPEARATDIRRRTRTPGAGLFDGHRNGELVLSSVRLLNPFAGLAIGRTLRG